MAHSLALKLALASQEGSRLFATRLRTLRGRACSTGSRNCGPQRGRWRGAQFRRPARSRTQSSAQCGVQSTHCTVQAVLAVLAVLTVRCSRASAMALRALLGAPNTGGQVQAKAAHVWITISGAPLGARSIALFAWKCRPPPHWAHWIAHQIAAGDIGPRLAPQWCPTGDSMRRLQPKVPKVS